MTGTRACPRRCPDQQLWSLESGRSVPHLRSAGRRGSQEALTGFDLNCPEDRDRAVKASPSGGLRPALTTLVADGPTSALAPPRPGDGYGPSGTPKTAARSPLFERALLDKRRSFRNDRFTSQHM